MARWQENDLFYAAGFLDGEGCFTTTNPKYRRPLIACENTYRPVIEWFHSTFGGRVKYGIPGKKANHRATHRWMLHDGNAAEFCAAIAPYLKEKAGQALLIIAINQTKSLRSGRCIDPLVARERERLATLLKETKRVPW